MQLQDIPSERIRNFGIIAHIDHGKSTLADRLLELTGCLSKNNSDGPTLDTLPVERERGITVKAQTASLFHRPPNGEMHMLNLIDTPGHADFTYEVERSLAAMQGALLLVDAVSGVQAQTVAHYWRARDYGISAILPIINKVDLPQANVDLVMEQLEARLGINTLDTPVLAISAKTGMNIEKIFPVILDHIPPPLANKDAPFQAALIDCWYREFRGVICMISVKEGTIKTGGIIKSATTDKRYVVEEVGILQPEPIKTGYLHAGQVGYVRCGMKSTHDALIGDTFLDLAANKPPKLTLPPKLRPIVFAGMFPAIRDEYEAVSMAVDRLLLNDSSVRVERIVSTALGPGWRLGFLGSLHMDVFGQRLEQEFDVDVILTTPNVSYETIFKDGTIRMISSAEEYPGEKDIINVREFREPFVKATIIFPASVIGAVSSLCSVFIWTILICRNHDAVKRQSSISLLIKSR